MVYVDALLLIAFALVYGLFAYVLGYVAGRGDGETSLRAARAANRRIRQQHADLARWIRTNWPDVFEAHRYGVNEGFQQGVAQARELEDDAA